MKTWLKSICEKRLQQSMRWVAEHDLSSHDLSQLEGRIILLQIKPCPWPIQLILGKPIGILLEDTTEADVRVELSFFHLQQLQQGHAITSLIKSGDLIIEGQLPILQQLVLWLQQIDIDLFEPVSQLIGDPATYHVQRFSRQSKRHIQSVFQTKKQQFAEYIEHEAQVILTRSEYESCKKKQKQLEQDIHQLEHQIQRLKETCYE
tara:strand:- start:2553 stop:3167 length:615 start_codon:yes stop_codon:yes gene_type:complete